MKSMANVLQKIAYHERFKPFIHGFEETAKIYWSPDYFIKNDVGFQ